MIDFCHRNIVVRSRFLTLFPIKNKNTHMKHNERHIDFLTNQLKKLQIDLNRTKEELKKLKKTVDKQRENRDNNKGAKDANGQRIDIGDKVTFVTKGSLNSTSGTVTKIREKSLMAEDKESRKIVRLHKNVVVDRNE